MKFFGLAGAVFGMVVAGGLLSAPAMATVIQTAVATNNYGTVTLTESVKNNKTTLTIDLNLLSDYKLVDSSDVFDYYLNLGEDNGFSVNSKTTTTGSGSHKTTTTNYTTKASISPDSSGYFTAKNLAQFGSTTNPDTLNYHGSASLNGPGTYSTGNDLIITLSCSSNCGSKGLDIADFIPNGNIWFSANILDPYTPGCTTSNPLLVTWTAAPKLVPEPMVMSMFGAGLAGLVGLRRRRKKSA